MSKRSAPYRHEDGSNCWTKGCSRSNFFVGQSAVTFTVSDFYSEAELPSLTESDLEISDAEHKASVDYLLNLISNNPTQTTTRQSAKVAPDQLTPLRSGAELNARYTFHNRLQKPYDPTSHGGVQNLTGDDSSWTKPLGAFWISTVQEGGLSEWDRLWGNRKEAAQNAGKHEHEVKFKDDAKVLVIDSLADYEALLERYPHYSKIEPDEAMAEFRLYGGAFSVFSPEGKVRRGLDWEKLAEDHDALMLTRKGLRQCGGGDYRQENAPAAGDISLYSWDFESAVVFHPHAVSVTPLS